MLSYQDLLFEFFSITMFPLAIFCCCFADVVKYKFVIKGSFLGGKILYFNL